MFIIDNKLEQVDDSLRKCLGDNNITIINDYINNYYEVMHQQDKVIACSKNLDNAHTRYQNECFSLWGGLHFLLHFSKFTKLGEEIDSASDKLVESERTFDETEKKYLESYERFLDSTVLERLELCRDFFSSTEQDVTHLSFLKDLILNNELELIEDHFIDLLDYLNDRKSYGKKKKTFRHDYEDLAERMYNVGLQHRLLRKTVENGYDASVVADVIDTCYTALETESKLDTSRFSHLNDDIQDYINETRTAINVIKTSKTKRR